MSHGKFANTVAVIGLMVLLFSLWACKEQPQSEPQQGGPSADEPTAIQHPTKTHTETPSLTPSRTASPKPTSKPFSTLTFTPTTRPSPTNTELPPLPDFDDVLAFGGAGAQFGCREYPPNPDSIRVEAGWFGSHVILCIFLQNAHSAEPIRLSLSQLGGSRMTLWSSDLTFDQTKRAVIWGGYTRGGGVIDMWKEDGSIQIALSIWLPVTLPPGNWRATVIRREGPPVSQDFEVSKQVGQSYINAVNLRSERELMPAWCCVGVIQSLQLSDNEPLRFVGTDYPPNVPVFVLLYKDMHGPYQLIEKKLAVSDDSGLVRGEFSAQLEPGSYLLYGITDSNTKLDGEEHITCHDALGSVIGAACDDFEIVPTSCSGAPPQRMVVSRRGFVCTQSESVRLRQGPARSADVIVQLPTGSQFTVTGGPACADNWSWWQVQTDDGSTGWISEGGDETDPYFICPLP